MGPIMLSALRDFWFPLLLAIIGIIPLFFAGSAAGNGRRAMLTVTVVLLFLAALSYIWGDPARGPFAYITNPRRSQYFVLQAGVGCRFPVSALKDGIDFSQCIRFTSQPLQLWIRKTWWSGLKVNASLYEGPNDSVLLFNDSRVQFVKEGADVNFDDYAFELVGPTREPVFQLVIEKDYSQVYVNALLRSATNVTILKGTNFPTKPIQDFQPADKLDRIFKYPSYLRQGERD
jgi:hypothetical protein